MERFCHQCGVDQRGDMLCECANPRQQQRELCILVRGEGRIARHIIIGRIKCHNTVRLLQCGEDAGGDGCRTEMFQCAGARIHGMNDNAQCRSTDMPTQRAGGANRIENRIGTKGEIVRPVNGLRLDTTSATEQQVPL